MKAKYRLIGLALAGASCFVAGSAQANSAAAEYFRNRADRSAVPKVLSQDEREY